MPVALQKEQEERKEAEAGVATFRRELASVKEKCASLDIEIEQHRAATSVLTRGTLHIFSKLARVLQCSRAL